MGVSQPVGLADLLAAWRRLGGAYTVEEIATALDLEVTALEPPQEASTDPRASDPPEPPEPVSDELEALDELEDGPDQPEPVEVRFEVEHLPPVAAEREKNVGIVAAPLAPDPEPVQLRRPSLFVPRLVRDLIRRSLSTQVVSSEPDAEGLVERLARAESLQEIPRAARLSLRRGVQVLRDISPGMAPYAEDQEQLLESIRSLVGDNVVQDLRCLGVPGPCWDPRGRVVYEPPKEGQKVLVLSDAGIGRIDGSLGRSTTEDWTRFLGRLRRLGSHVILYVPYRRDRWPGALRAVAEVHHWDRPVLPPTPKSEAVPRAAGEESTARELLLQMGDRLPGVVDLARSVALAARVEPGLLRRTRLELVPWVGAGGEADLAFSELVENRSSAYFILMAPVQRLLLRQLAAKASSVEDQWQLLTDYRREQGAPESIRLEETINRHFCEMVAETTPRGRARKLQKMEEALAPALASLKRGGDVDGLAHWALDVGPRLPPELRTRPTALALQLAAGRRAEAKAVPIDLLAAGEDGARAVASAGLNRVPIGVRWDETGLTFVDPAAAEDHPIKLPDTHPRVFWLDPPSGTRSDERRYLEPDEALHIPAAELPESRASSQSEPTDWDYDAFVAYWPQPELDWLRELVPRLEEELSPLLGRPARIRIDWGVLPSNEQLRFETEQRLADSAALLFELSPASLESEWLRWELETFHKAIGTSESELSRIFALWREPLARESIPAPLDRVPSYDFYNPKNDKPLDFERDAKSMAAAVEKLARDLSRLLQRGEPVQSTISALPEVHVRTLAGDVWKLHPEQPQAEVVEEEAPSDAPSEPPEADGEPKLHRDRIARNFPWFVEQLAERGFEPYRRGSRSYYSEKCDTHRYRILKTVVRVEKKNRGKGGRTWQFLRAYDLADRAALEKALADRAFRKKKRPAKRPRPGRKSKSERAATGSAVHADPWESLFDDAGSPLVNRAGLRQILKGFRGEDPRYWVATVRGPERSGKSYSWTFVRHFERSLPDVKAARIPLGPGPLASASDNLGRLIADTLGVRPPKWERGAEYARAASAVARELVREIATLDATWWLVIEHIGETELGRGSVDLLRRLARSLLRGDPPNLRLLLITPDDALDPAADEKVTRETLVGLSREDVTAFVRDALARAGRTDPAFLDSIETRLAKLESPYRGRDLGAVNRLVARAVSRR